MQPTLNAEGDIKHDMVYINKVLPYGYEDIVVVERPTNSIDVNYIIKRVVGMPGDKIKIMQNQADKKAYNIYNEEKMSKFRCGQLPSTHADGDKNKKGEMNYEKNHRVADGNSHALTLLRFLL